MPLFYAISISEAPKSAGVLWLSFSPMRAFFRVNKKEMKWSESSDSLSNAFSALCWFPYWFQKARQYRRRQPDMKRLVNWHYLECWKSPYPIVVRLPVRHGFLRRQRSQGAVELVNPGLFRFIHILHAERKQLCIFHQVFLHHTYSILLHFSDPFVGTIEILSKDRKAKQYE